MEFTHIDKNGNVKMVDITSKDTVLRRAAASGIIKLQPDTIDKLKNKLLKKGDPIAAATIAGISGAKRTSELIPLCHNIPLDNVELEYEISDDGIRIISTAVSTGKTGVEMEALTAVSIAALTIYDMCKAVDKNMMITDIRLDEKTKEHI